MTSSTPTAVAATTTTTTSSTPFPPPIMWAQRNDVLYVTIVAECKDVDLKFTEDTMSFKAVSVCGSKLYEVSLNFLHKIVPDKVTQKNTARCIQFTIPKVESGPYWTNLTTDKKKPHFLKVDFNKWDDENSGDDEVKREDDSTGFLDSMMMGGANGFDGSKMSPPNLDDIYDESDSDDEDLPNLEEFN